MATPNSSDLRVKLRDLEAAYSTAGSALLDAQAAHTGAVRRAISTNDSTAADATKAVLDACLATHQQASTMVDVARTLLAETVVHEREAAEAAARIEMASRLTQLDKMAATADAHLAKVVSTVVATEAFERDIFTVAHGAGLRPLLAMQSRHALRSAASRLESAASALGRGDAPQIDEPVAKTARDARQNIEAAIRL